MSDIIQYRIKLPDSFPLLFKKKINEEAKAGNYIFQFIGIEFLALVFLVSLRISSSGKAEARQVFVP